MTITWKDKQGSRDRLAVAILITGYGEIHKFKGQSISAVCHSSAIDFKKSGKWSFTTYELIFHETTKFVSWLEDFNTGKTFPQNTWLKGFAWLQEQTKFATFVGFENFIRENYPKTAAHWDTVSAAEKEFLYV